MKTVASRLRPGRAICVPGSGRWLATRGSGSWSSDIGSDLWQLTTSHDEVFRDFASDASDGFDFERELELRAPLKAMTSRGILRPNTVRLASDDWTFASEACGGYESYTTGASSRSYDPQRDRSFQPSGCRAATTLGTRCRTTAPALKKLQQSLRRICGDRPRAMWVHRDSTLAG